MGKFRVHVELVIDCDLGNESVLEKQDINNMIAENINANLMAKPIGLDREKFKIFKLKCNTKNITNSIKFATDPDSYDD